MQYKVIKDGVTATLTNETHVAAYLNNGWKIQDKGADKAPKAPVIEKEQKESVTKSEVNKMDSASLSGLCKENGIDSKGMTSGEMKKAIIEKLGL